MKKFMNREGVQRAVGDQCQCGLKSSDDKGTAPARKRTGFLTNAVCIAQRLNRKCPNRREYKSHRHIALEIGRLKVAQVYPDKFCREIRRGIQEQVQRDRDGQYIFASAPTCGNECSKQLLEVANELKEGHQTVEEEDEDLGEIAWGDMPGGALRTQRSEERPERGDIICSHNEGVHQSAGERNIQLHWEGICISAMDGR